MHRRLPVIRRWIHVPLILSALLILTVDVKTSVGQETASAPVSAWAETSVGSEAERYLRILQIGGTSRLYPVSIRGWGIDEIERMAVDSTRHPWAARYGYVPGDQRLGWIRPSLQVSYNSAFPYGGDDGPIWAGKGITLALNGGAAVQFGPLSASLAPVVFSSQNASFPLTPKGREPPEAFRDPRTPDFIDLPQRFGERAYSRIDPGQSTVRLDLRGLAVGISSANQQWGPARHYPIILGPNAGGYLHTFLGTGRPLNLWIGRLHGRLVWGALEQSAFSPVPESHKRRFMSGLVAVFSPRGVPGLELGGSRFFHLEWPEGGISANDLFRPFESLLKSRLDEVDVLGENQLASVFVRWAFPGTGLEIYAEFGREDHNHDLRDLLLEPDHASAYLFGLQKVWGGNDSAWTVLRAEVAEATPSHLLKVRPQQYFYNHSVQRQGHTHRGQLLGSPAIYGGGGAILALDRYHTRGRLTAFVERTDRQDGTLAVPRRKIVDLMYAAGMESVFFRGRYDLAAGLTGAWNLNRDFEDDVVNWNFRIGVRAGWE